MLFEQKKIRIETLSEYLASVRKDLNLSAEEVAKKTGIKLKFMQSLESGDFKLLPADVYVLGFLQELAELYAVDAWELVNQYKKEKNVLKQVAGNRQALAAGWFKKSLGRLVITPKVLSLILGLTFVILTLGYIVWQLWSINKTPILVVNQPQDNAVIIGNVVNVAGNTDPGVDVSVNGQSIFVDSHGNFLTQAALSPGPEEITITASNRFGKLVNKTLNVTGAGSVAVTGGPLQMILSFNGTSVVTFSIDDQPAQTVNFSAGDTKTFSASQKILISTSDAGVTKVSLNGQNLGFMGRPKEQLNNVPFFAQPINATTTN